MTEMSPIHIADFMFHKKPDDVTEIGLILDDEYTVTDLFEILLIIFMEGINILYDLKNVSDLSVISKDHLLYLNHWFNKLKVKIHITVVNKEEKIDPYCQILLNKDKYIQFFTKFNIKDEYHIVRNNKFEFKNEIQDYKSIFIVSDKIFIISFELII